MFGNFLNDHIALNFDHNDAEHWFESATELPETWPATMTVNEPFVTHQSTGEWSMQSQGKNHRDGCTGEGGLGSITWRAEVIKQ